MLPEQSYIWCPCVFDTRDNRVKINVQYWILSAKSHKEKVIALPSKSIFTFALESGHTFEFVFPYQTTYDASKELKFRFQIFRAIIYC